MKTLIIYATSHGCSARVAREIGSRIGNIVDYADLREDQSPDLTFYQRIIIGGSIRAGMIQRRVKEFCVRNRETLLQKELGLFICCMDDGEPAWNQLSDAYPDELRQHAKSMLITGMEPDFDRLSLPERFTGRNAVCGKGRIKRTDKEAIERFARKMDRTFIPMMLFI